MMEDFSSTHRRVLLVKLRCVDESLQECELLLRHGVGDSPFRQHLMDLTEEEKQQTLAGIAEIRRRMCELLESFDIPLEPPNIKARRILSTQFHFACVNFEELAAKYLRGYGPMSEESKGKLNRASAELQKMAMAMIRALET